MSKFSRETAILRDKAGAKVLDLIENFRAFIAGGAITSLFSSEPINDFDLFFLSQSDIDAAISKYAEEEKKVVTDAAISLSLDGRKVQLIKAAVGTPEQVITAFDFTICEGAWNGKEFFFGKDFFQHLAQRRLVFKTTAEYPICSLYRTRKYIKRGYNFSGIDAIKLGLRIQALNISTYADLRRQLMGIDTLFLKDLTDSFKEKSESAYDLNEFLETMESWLSKLDALTGEE